MADQPIDEDEEEIMNDYLSDCSSNSSQFSLKKRYLSLDLQKLIDRLEPADDSSAVQSKFYGNVNETIEEEISDHDDECEKKSRLSHSSQNSNQKHKKKGDHYLSFMSIISDKIRRARSHVCELESETIAEELEYEYEYQQIQTPLIDENMHHFKVPARLRADSETLFDRPPGLARRTHLMSKSVSENVEPTLSLEMAMTRGLHANATLEDGQIAQDGGLSSGTEEEKTERSQRTHSSGRASFHKLHPAQLQAMKRFGKKGKSGGHRNAHSQHSHHSGKNLSASSLPTITEEPKQERSNPAFFDSHGIQEAADAEEVDEVSV